MKNLNKKIGAVALASMVIFGGVVASGAKSFASEVESSLVNDISNSDVEEFNELLRKKSNFIFKAFGCYRSIGEAREAIDKNYASYSKVNKNPVSINNINLINKRLERLYKNGSKVFILKYESKFFIVALPSYLKK